MVNIVADRGDPVSSGVPATVGFIRAADVG